jgi:GAF domain-containing protein
MLNQMKDRLFRAEVFDQAIWTILDDAIALHGAEYGNVQLLAEDELVIVAQQGLPLEFLRAFRHVKKEDGCACGRALRSRTPVVIRDVDADVEFAAFRSEAKLAGFRAVQSTPLAARHGRPLGVISTHFANIHEPTKVEMETLQAYGAIASEFAFKLLGDTPLPTMARRLSKDLYDRIGDTVAASIAAERGVGDEPGLS